MKFQITTIFLTCLSIVLMAQTNVKLDINHLQGSNSFAINQTSTTTLDETYNAYRLEYYMAEFSLEHDGGMITEIDSFWVLVNATGPTSVDLGQFNITSLEAIHFSIGVEQSFNHLDPSQWPSGHPLAPKSPSMHWGWNAGYRFFAMEGKCGDPAAYTYELHSLGDNYYYNQRIVTAGAISGSDLVITLNADYDRVFDDLTLGTGVVDHGEFPNNIKSLQNMRDRVFTSPEGNGNSLSPLVGISQVDSDVTIRLYPNPSESGVFNLSSEDNLEGASVVVYDNLSRVIYQEKLQNWSGSYMFEIKKNGHFILVIDKNQETMLREAIIVSE